MFGVRMSKVIRNQKPWRLHKYGLIQRMVRETADRSEDASGNTNIRKNRELTLALVLFLVIIFFVWVMWQIRRLPFGSSGAIMQSLAGIGLLICLLTIVIERLLNLMHVGMRARYRISFLSSTGFGWLFCLYWKLSESSYYASISLITDITLLTGWVLGSAFVGGLIITAYREGLVENNYPPSEEIASQVYQQHVRLIDTPVKTPVSKRLFDILLSIVGLCLSSPIWVLSALLIWLEDPGALLFVKNSVGKGGKNFQQYKFRTMIRGAEESTGPIMASEGDQRVLRTGKLLRKTALDELPQLINILKGEMSFVGPRPQRTVMVNEYLVVMQEYAYRHLVLPGLAGLAQVVGDYYLTPRQKLRFDRIYIRHANLGFDLLLILLAFLITFWFRWKKDWDGRLPRWLLHGRSGS